MPTEPPDSVQYHKNESLHFQNKEASSTMPENRLRRTLVFTHLKAQMG